MNLLVLELLSIPSPSFSAFKLGPLTLHLYALCILAGVAVAWAWGRARFRARGGDPAHLEAVVTLAVLAGIVGARVYHVITDAQLYFGPGRNPWDAFKVWEGGLGIWGGVVFGAGAVWWYCRRHGLHFPSMADVLAPTLLVAQAIGRLGNWFNQELFGRPTDLPWALRIDPENRPAGYESHATFHPTFAYELVWNLIGAGVLVWLERRFKLGRGKVFLAYIAWYTFGRFFIEGLRIDPANQAAGLRVNEYVSIVCFVTAAVALVVGLRSHPGVTERPFEGVDAGDEPEALDAEAAQDEASEVAVGSSDETATDASHSADTHADR